MSLRRASALASVLSLAAIPSAHAEDGPAALRAHVGPPPSPHAMPGLDAARSRRSNAILGPSPRVDRRVRIAFGIGRGLVTRADGGFVVLHPSARASRFDAQGKSLYALKLSGEPASAPVVTASGATAFVVSGELWQVDERGVVRSRTALGDADFSARSILSQRDGGVLVASNAWLVKVSAFGEIVFRRPAPETPLELLETPAGVLCVTAPGSVFRIDGSGRLSKLGELGGTTQFVTAGADSALLLARTGNHRVVTFDSKEHRLHASIEDAALELDGPVLLSQNNVVQVFTSDGLLVRYSADGSEAQRVPVDPGARKSAGNDDALLLADGRLLLARAGADTVVVSTNGEVIAIANSACPDPVGLYAAGPRAVLIACRSGNILRLE
jgi:hypothetical protein